MKTGYLLTRALAFYRATTDIIRPRRTTDQVVIGTSQQGSSCSTLAHLSVDTGTENQEAVATRGRVYVQGKVVLEETTVHLTCQVLTATSRVAMYMIADKIVFAYTLSCNGQVAYLAGALDGASIAWTNSTVAPS